MNIRRIGFSVVIILVILSYPIYVLASNINESKYEHINIGFQAVNNDYRNIAVIENKLDRKLNIVHIFKSINETPKEDEMQYILDKGYILLLTLEPWDRNKSNNHIYLPSSVLNGSIDADIEIWSNAINNLSFNKNQLVMRIMQEPNGNWYPWCAYYENSTSQLSKQEYEYIVRNFKNYDDRLIFMWSINFRTLIYEKGNIIISYNISNIIPEDSYFDIVGISGYNRISSKHNWNSFNNIFNNIYLEIVKRTDKPIWLAEVSSVSIQGDKISWINDMFYQVKYNYPNIKSIVWFNERKKFEDIFMDWEFDSTIETRDIFKENVKIENLRRKI